MPTCATSSFVNVQIDPNLHGYAPDAFPRELMRERRESHIMRLARTSLEVFGAFLKTGSEAFEELPGWKVVRKETAS